LFAALFDANRSAYIAFGAQNLPQFICSGGPALVNSMCAPPFPLGLTAPKFGLTNLGGMAARFNIFSQLVISAIQIADINNSK